MFSKADSQKIKREFWIEFAETYPRKWMLYDTKIKDFSFKFYVDNKKAQVTLDIEPKDEEKRKIYFEKIESLKQILLDEFIEDIVLERHFHLETGKKKDFKSLPKHFFRQLYSGNNSWSNSPDGSKYPFHKCNPIGLRL